jgi:hypothetical protein
MRLRLCREIFYIGYRRRTVRITIASKDTVAPALADMCRTSIYNDSTIETYTGNGVTVSGRAVLYQTRSVEWAALQRLRYSISS